jgi:hypothetical protein
MFSRIRIVLGLFLLAILIAPSTAFAKGGFSFIAITGPNLKEEIRSNDLALTEDFFAFANFYQDKTKAPADPGVGYEIRRYYIDGKREIAFDHLHYYPETGFVYYDGIVNGSSEYDGQWYMANSEVKTVFESALSTASINSANAMESSASASSTAQTAASDSLPYPPLILLVAAGIAVALLFAHRLRKASAH